MVTMLPTGIDILDRKLGGGIPEGSLVALCADPASQAELLLYELTAARGTLYLSLNRTEHAVKQSVDRSPARTGNPTVRHVSGEAPLDNAGKLASALPDSSNLIIDPINVLESQDPPSRYRAFLNDVQNHLINTSSLGIFHCLTGQHIPKLRDATENFADVIFELETTVANDEVENRLAIPKYRGGRAPKDIIKLELAEQVAIDTSRDIA